ncbi:SCO7613 C-terminal domain-containing membrane protein [Blastococcus jejuensis]
MHPPNGAWSPPCPVCGRPSADAGPGPCRTCGLPAVGQAALVVARIGVTLTELTRDRDALLATLRAAAPGAPVAAPPAVAPAPPPIQPSAPWAPAPPAPPPWTPPPPPPPGPPPRPRRRLSPPQVLGGLGALLLVAASITFVAVAWTRLGVVVQSAVMLLVTGLLCGASAWTARKGLRATEEALAAAGAALLAVDLGAARALGLFELEDVRLRWWWVISCAVVVAVTAVLGRLTRSTATWPLVALLAAQPLPFLVLPTDLLTGPAGVAAALLVAAGDAVAARSLRRYLAPVAWVLAGLATSAAVFGGLTVAVEGPVGDSWATTALLTLAGAAAVALTRFPRPGGLLPAPVTTTAVAAVIAGLALAGSLELTATVGAVVAAGLGLVLLTLAVFAVRLPVPCAALTSAGAALAFMGAAFLSDDRDARPLALVILAATVPAALAAVRLPALRRPATGAALLAPGLSILLARADGVLPVTVAGLLLALLAATAFALAALRAGRGEEWVCAAGGTLAGVAAGVTSADVGAWGQVGIQLGIAGAAAGCYAVVAGRRWVGVLAVADLVLASWIAVAGARVETPEAYTLPAALGLLVIAIPQLRARARSWAAEGAATAVALVPSAVVVVADPTALRLVLVVATAAGLTVAGTFLHRQAPFVVGSVVLAFVVVGRLAPYTPLLPRWLTLGAAGLLLLVVSATYERRLQQAREAVAWVAQMH